MTAIIVSFPAERIVRDRQTQIELRKAFRMVRRKFPKQTPSQWWESVSLGEAIKTGWDKRRELEREEAMREDLRNLGAMSDEGFAALLARIAHRSRADQSPALDQPPPSAA